MKNNNINMFLAALVVVLFIGFGVYPAVAVEPIISANNTTDERINPKDYLFQTIIDIANNPDVKNLLKQHSGRIQSFNHYDKSVFREILLKKPILLFLTLFTKPSMTTDYLNFVYDRGVEITSVLGEEKTYETLHSSEITNNKLYEELDKIIVNDEELSFRMDTLAEINLDTLEWNYPVICAILEVLYNSIYGVADLIFSIIDFFGGYDTILGAIIFVIFAFPLVFLDIIGFFVYGFGYYFDCW